MSLLLHLQYLSSYIISKVSQKCVTQSYQNYPKNVLNFKQYIDCGTFEINLLIKRVFQGQKLVVLHICVLFTDVSTDVLQNFKSN